MKVLFISHNLSRTGAPLALLQELNYICTNCNDIQPELLLMAGGELDSEFRKLCPMHEMWSRETLFKRLMRRMGIKRFIYPYLYMFRQGQFDEIYVNTVAALEIGYQLKLKLGIPLIGHFHESEALVHMFKVKPEWVSDCDILLTVSNLAKKNFVDNYGVPSSKIRLQRPISFWIDNAIKCSELQTSNVPNSDRIKAIGCFTNGNWFKATETIPIIVKLFVDKYPQVNCRFLIIGGMPEEIKYRLEFDIKKMNLTDSVVFVGMVDNPLKILSQVSLLMLPSREDSFPLVAQEAGLMGKPIVGFEGATGAAEWIKEGAGILVPYMDLVKMVDAIYELLENDSLNRQYGEKGRLLVKNMYSVESQMLSVVSSIRELSSKFK